MPGVPTNSLLLRQWCGDAAGTTSNVKLMAECIARRPLADKEVFRVGSTVVGCYFPGVGLAGCAGLPGFVEYVWNGAIAIDIRDRCVEAYKFIVDHFTEDSEVWVLGLSRGAFTVRSVAGMIHNFGILNRREVAREVTLPLSDLCNTIYRHYRSTDLNYGPEGPYALDFKARNCVNLHGRSSIKFMGLLDTVVSVGVPEFVAGSGLEFKFHDDYVSNEVENVYHALAAHDRLFGFVPTFVRRTPGTKTNPGTLQEVWFPGAHYDVGRQRFVPFRTTGWWPERILHYMCNHTNALLLNIEPTPACSVEPLKWMLTCMRQTDPYVMDSEGYNSAVHRCLQVPSRHCLSFAPRAFNRDAFDHMSNWFFGRFHPLLANLALRDRDVPAYSDAKFIGGDNGGNNEPAFICPRSGFKSRAYNTFKGLRPNGVVWVNGQAQ